MRIALAFCLIASCAFAATRPAIVSLSYNGVPFVNGVKLAVNKPYTVTVRCNSTTARVKFIQDGYLIVTDPTVPFTYTRTFGVAGTHKLQATPINP